MSINYNIKYIGLCREIYQVHYLYVLHLARGKIAVGLDKKVAVKLLLVESLKIIPSKVHA